MTDFYDFSVIRALRKRENISLQELSAKTGIALSALSKLERNRTTAEVETLHRIAKAFGLNLSDLFALAEKRTSQLAFSDAYRSGGFTFERVAYGNVRVMLASAKTGAKTSKPGLHRDDYELCWVRRGSIRLTLDAEIHDLKSGMSIQFDALLEHAYEALEDSEMIILHLKKGKRF